MSCSDNEFHFKQRNSKKAIVAIVSLHHTHRVGDSMRDRHTLWVYFSNCMEFEDNTYFCGKAGETGADGVQGLLRHRETRSKRFPDVELAPLGACHVWNRYGGNKRV